MAITKRLSWPFYSYSKPLPAVPKKGPLILPPLPSIIISHIVSFASDSATLRSCSLVSREFYLSVEPQLFTFISIRLSCSKENPYHAFLEFITKSGRRHAPFVRSVKLFDFYLEDAQSTWLAFDMCIVPRILVSLPNLVHLGVHAHRGISSASRAMITSPTLASQLRSLTGRGLSLNLHTILENCPSLRGLRLADVNLIGGAETVDDTTPPSTPDSGVELDITDYLSSKDTHSPLTLSHSSIRELCLQLTPATSTELVDQLLHDSLWRSFGRLDLLDLDLIHFPYPRSIQRLLAATSRCTNHLRLRAYQTSSLGFHVHPTVPNISYHFKVLPCTGNPSFIDVFQPFNRLHRHRASSNIRSHPPNRWRGVSDLRLELEMRDTFSIFDRQDWEWAWLDEVLGGVRRKVSFVLVMVVPGEVEIGERKEMESRILDCLPNAVKRGVLRVAVQWVQAK